MKALLPLLNPLVILWLLLGIWVLPRVLRRKWRECWLPGSAWVILSLISCTGLPSWLISHLESATPPVRIEALPTADAIVCLGGGVEPSLVEPTELHLKTAADRISTSLAAFRQGKAPVLVLGGGGYARDGQVLSEADHIQAALIKMGIPAEALVSLGTCADTHDEAIKVAAVAKAKSWSQLILITSAAHMPRAQATFAKAGIVTLPLPCNYLAAGRRVTRRPWLHLPKAEGFEIFGAWSHEVIGDLVYRWRGWL
jgi:uncharacterized SAM-binding protein YcdF (DUF218 family)